MNTANKRGAVERRDREPLPDRPAPRTDRIAVVLNGNARSVSRDIVSLLDQIVMGGDLYVSRSLAEGEEIARAIVFRGYGTVLTGGGDGTFVHTVTHVVKEARAHGVKPPRFGILRLGTGNALAWVLGNSPPRRGMGLAADIARLRREGGCRPMRLVDVDGTLTPFAGLGIDAIALTQMMRTKKFFARTPVLNHFASSGLTYLTSIAGLTLPYFLFAKDPHATVYNEGATVFRLGPDGRLAGAPIERGEVIYKGPARMVAVATIPYYGFGFRIFPFANEREDRMHMRVINIRSVDVPQNIVKIWKGRSGRARTAIRLASSTFSSSGFASNTTNPCRCRSAAIPRVHKASRALRSASRSRSSTSTHRHHSVATNDRARRVKCRDARSSCFVHRDRRSRLRLRRR
jgi:hypothetical protein